MGNCLPLYGGAQLDSVKAACFRGGMHQKKPLPIPHGGKQAKNSHPLGPEQGLRPAAYFPALHLNIAIDHVEAVGMAASDALVVHLPALQPVQRNQLWGAAVKHLIIVYVAIDFRE